MFDRASPETAASLIYRTAPSTPQYLWPVLAARASCEVWGKRKPHTDRRITAECAGAAALTALLQHESQHRRRVAIILSGGNIDCALSIPPFLEQSRRSSELEGYP